MLATFLKLYQNSELPFSTTVANHLSRYYSFIVFYFSSINLLQIGSNLNFPNGILIDPILPGKKTITKNKR